MSKNPYDYNQPDEIILNGITAYYVSHNNTKIIRLETKNKLKVLVGLHQIINNINSYDLDYNKIVEMLNNQNKEYYVIIEEYKGDKRTNKFKITFRKNENTGSTEGKVNIEKNCVDNDDWLKLALTNWKMDIEIKKE